MHWEFHKENTYGQWRSITIFKTARAARKQKLDKLAKKFFFLSKLAYVILSLGIYVVYLSFFQIDSPLSSISDGYEHQRCVCQFLTDYS